MELLSLPQTSLFHSDGVDSTLLATGILRVTQAQPTSSTPAPLEAAAPVSTSLSSNVPSAQSNGPRTLSLVLPGESEAMFEVVLSSNLVVQKLSALSYLIPIEETSDKPASDAKTTGSIRLDLDEKSDIEVLAKLDKLLKEDVASLRNQVALMDENASVVGTLSLPITEPEVELGAADEVVVIEYDEDKAKLTVRPMSKWERIPNPTGSAIISTADYLSRGIVVAAEVIGQGVEFASSKFVDGTQPTKSPLMFSATTRRK